MSFSKLLITARLGSPLCGDPPFLDSILMWELGRRMGISTNINRNNSFDPNRVPPIPLGKMKVSKDAFVWRVSNPIFPSLSGVSMEYHHKHFPSSDASLLKDGNLKTVLTGSGPYKSRRNPEIIKNISEIKWFAYADKRETRKLLKKIMALGHKRSYGYGKITEWIFEETNQEADVFVIDENQNKILMKTVPYEFAIQNNLKGFIRSYGSFRPPYWHPENYTDIAIPN